MKSFNSSIPRRRDWCLSASGFNPWLPCVVIIVAGIAPMAHAQSVPAPSQQAYVAPFPDVPPDHWAYQAVNELHQLGIVVGYPDAAYNDANARDFEYLPRGAWEYSAVDTLQKAGIVIGYPDGDYGSLPGHMRRYDFTVAIARLLRAFDPKLPKSPGLIAIRNEIFSRLQNDQAALDGLISLIDEFQPELKEMGVDGTPVRARLETWRIPDGVVLEMAPHR